MEREEIAKRFEMNVTCIGDSESAGIVVDKETGVQYLYAKYSSHAGLTLLVDRDGKPLLDPKYAK